MGLFDNNLDVFFMNVGGVAAMIPSSILILIQFRVLSLSEVLSSIRTLQKDIENVNGISIALIVTCLEYQ